jgi:hypothetical protein
MPRYAILRHETPPSDPRPLHWDLLLATGNQLRAWALAEEPQPGRAIPAASLPDHRTVYLDYEGPLSGDRGAVTQWDAGTFQWLELTSEHVAIRLDGRRLQGTLRLARAAGPSDRWECTFAEESGSP